MLRRFLPAAAVVLVASAPALVAQPTPLPGLGAPGRVLRDIHGIPHIVAQSEHDLAYLQGWVHAQDRLFQMDLTRRQASGTLAELLGPAALASDVESRTIGLRRAAEASVAEVSVDTRAVLDAYAAGVNAWVASHPLPPEYGALEVTRFTPWTSVDSVVIAKAIAFSLSFDLDIETTQALLAYRAAGQAAGFDGTALFFEDLFRSAPLDPASTVPDATSTEGLAAAAKAAQRLAGYARAAGAIRPETAALAAAYRERVKDLPLFRQAVTPRGLRGGSNEWAVAPRLTSNGRPLMANDPHLALDVPATFYEVHLNAPPDRINVIGSGFAGVPFVILGQNQWLTWGATTNPLDVTDTFQERIVPDPTSPSGLATVHRGANEPIIPLPQVFRFNQPGNGTPDDLQTAPAGGTVGGAAIPPAVLVVPRRSFGPIVALDTAAGTALSVQYTGFSATREIEAFRIWNRAKNLDEFRAGLEFFDVGSQNWAVADIHGNIAYFTSAEMPLREDLQAGRVQGLPPFFIRDGGGGNEWVPIATVPPGQAVPYAILPFAEMPQVVNPPAGFFVNANNDPAGTTLDNDPLNQLRPGGGIYYLNPAYDPGTRAGRITQLLEAKIAAGPVTAEDMAEIQADVVLLDAQRLVPHILAAFANANAAGAPAQLAVFGADPRIEEAVGRLAAWDFSTPTGIPEGWDASDRADRLFPPSEAEVRASVAATIYSVWRGQIIQATVDAAVAPFGLPTPGSGQAVTALVNLFESFPQRRGVGASGIDFFAGGGAGGPAVRRDTIILACLADALALLAGDPFRPAFGGSTDQDDYRWGRLHRLVLDHPLGGPFSIPPAGGAFPPPLPDLAGIPVDGGFGVVDASSHSARADSAEEFRFGSGPVRRYVGEPGYERLSIEGRSSLPGGESGVLGSPWYVNLLPEWLANETHPLRHRAGDLAGAVASRELFVPGS